MQAAHPLLLAASLIGFLILLVHQMWASTQKYARRRALLRRVRRGRKAEQDAAAWLSSLGFDIVDREVNRVVRILVDGEAVEASVRADLLVRKGNRTYVAEVKSGPEASDIAHRPTRRQLLEYAYAFETDRVLLVDMESRRLSEVAFQWDKTESRAQPLPLRMWMVFGLVFVAIGAVFEAKTTALASFFEAIDSQHLTPSHGSLEPTLSRPWISERRD